MSQKENNAFLDRSDWDRYASHREMVTNMLIVGLDRIRRQSPYDLSIWGAGKCNDVELKALLNSFAKLRLVDIRSEDLTQAVQNQQCADSAAIELVGGCDLTGVNRNLKKFGKRADERLLPKIVDQANRYAGPDTEQSDVLVSNALLSQLMDHVVDSVGEQHPSFPEIMLAIRNRHLDLLIEYTRPGGVAFLVTDVVSSATLPQLSTDVENLKSLMNKAINESNFFHGTNPAAIVHYLRHKSPHRNRLVSIDPSDPWIWDGPANLHRAVVAIRLCLAE